mmetsp:Transcript_19057/g.44077  ORF Transcript_19057/g.44077 Transcript_19057/m.44077 type:complete len:455 (+) Transcript_19057:830-2194(+)
MSVRYKHEKAKVTKRRGKPIDKCVQHWPVQPRTRVRKVPARVDAHDEKRGRDEQRNLYSSRLRCRQKGKGPVSRKFDRGQGRNGKHDFEYRLLIGTPRSLGLHWTDRKRRRYRQDAKDDGFPLYSSHQDLFDRKRFRQCLHHLVHDARQGDQSQHELHGGFCPGVRPVCNGHHREGNQTKETERRKTAFGVPVAGLQCLQDCHGVGSSAIEHSRQSGPGVCRNRSMESLPHADAFHSQKHPDTGGGRWIAGGDHRSPCSPNDPGHAQLHSPRVCQAGERARGPPLHERHSGVQQEGSGQKSSRHPGSNNTGAKVCRNFFGRRRYFWESSRHHRFPLVQDQCGNAAKRLDIADTGRFEIWALEGLLQHVAIPSSVRGTNKPESAGDGQPKQRLWGRKIQSTVPGVVHRDAIPRVTLAIRLGVPCHRRLDRVERTTASRRIGAVRDSRAGFQRVRG